MLYQEPRPSAALVITGILCSTVAGFLWWLAIMTSLTVIMALLAAIAALLGSFLFLVGLWRFLSAVDGAALHRWQSVTVAKDGDLAESREAQRIRENDDTPWALG
jgi:hypothetical protein